MKLTKQLNNLKKIRKNMLVMSFGTIWDQLGEIGTIWDYLGPFGIIFENVGPFGTI